MAVFASLNGRLAQLLSPAKSENALRSHVGLVPNPVSERSKHLQSRILTSGLSTALASLSFILSLGRSNAKPLEKVERAEMVVYNAMEWNERRRRV